MVFQDFLDFLVFLETSEVAGIGASVPYLAQSLSCGIQYTFYNIGYT